MLYSCKSLDDSDTNLLEYYPQVYNPKNILSPLVNYKVVIALNNIVKYNNIYDFTIDNDIRNYIKSLITWINGFYDENTGKLNNNALREKIDMLDWITKDAIHNAFRLRNNEGFRIFNNIDRHYWLI